MAQTRELMIDMLRFIKDKNASDLHLSVGMPPYIRIHGEIRRTDFQPFSREQCENLLFSLISEEEKKLFAETKVLDFSFGEPGLGRFRVNIYQQRGTIAAAVRILPFDVVAIENLGLPIEPAKQFCRQANGLILVCGAVGSGKTTTLAAMIDYINRTRRCHIISIEDPIEYVHRNVEALVHQIEIRRDTPNFYNALKFILREDPDVVVIGEMRDLDTITSALAIAETGHLVLATLHTGDTSESIRRIVDAFPPGQQPQVVAQLSYCLMGVLNQALIPRIDGTGRVLATEVMVITPAIQNLIRENKVEQLYSHLQIGTSYGMQTMNQSLAELVRRGLISHDVAAGHTKRTKEFTKLLESNDA
jgi:twitching motility protein PilT